ncbi:MAG: cytochrome b/b6 domain-containing protein [Nitrospirae bacterium]|nr:cytochrome b/b6 domain-containing protein [Nitrospirota bacterium]
MSNMIRKAGPFEIVNHWALAISFFALVLSGFGFLFHLEQMNALFGSFSRMRFIHNWAGVIFMVSLFLTMFTYLPVSLRLGSDDIGWILKAGGYLSKKAVVPPQDIINTGQKLYYLVFLLTGSAISASGLGIWFIAGVKKWVLISHLVHNISFDLLVTIIPLHIYLGTLANPGTFRIMVYGTVPLEWARKRHEKWVRRMGY